VLQKSKEIAFIANRSPSTVSLFLAHRHILIVLMVYLEEEFRTALDTAVADFRMPRLKESITEKLAKHYSMMVDWNSRVNLTRIIRPDEAARLHYAESLLGAGLVGDARSILDVGSGAGFPAIPLALMRGDALVTALESNRKKALFLSEVKDTLPLDNLIIERSRLEEFDWSGFDLVASRALDRAEQIWSAAIKELGERQRLMLYCGPDLLEKVLMVGGSSFKAETHAIPKTEARIVAVISRRA
jgi:16S rRNA (guanine(527)-N(7))-methyltransferase RsmG